MKRFVACIFVLSLYAVAAPVFAAWHLYLVPVIGDGKIRIDPRMPKYLTALGVQWSLVDYGFQPVALVAANVDSGTDTALQANADVTRIPDNLDQLLGAGAVNAVQTALENRNIPAGWVTQALSYRTVLRTIWGFFAFVQRYSFISGNTSPIIAAAVNLDTQFNQLPSGAQTNLQSTATSLGLSSAGLTGASTLRQILKNISDQWGQRSFTLGGIVI